MNHPIRSSQSRPGRRHAARLLAASVSVTAIALAACAKPPPPPARRAVRVIEVVPRDSAVGSRHAGSLEPRNRVDLNFKVAGRVSSLLELQAGSGRRPVQEGDEVRRGQVLATLDPGDFVVQARASAAGLAAARAQERAVESALAQAEADVKRARYLFESETIARAELDRAETGLATARDTLDAARAQSRLKAEQLALAERARADTRLVSPIDGTVGRRNVAVGESVAPSQPAFTILDVREMRTVFGVPDVRVGGMRDGRRVPVEVDALPGRVLLGTVTKVSPVPDPALRSFPVEVTISNADGALRAGMVATATLVPEGESAATLVPLPAIARGASGKGFVAFVVDGRGKADARAVDLGDLRQNDVLVARGLSPGDRVVVEGAQFLHDGEMVEVVP